MSAIAWRAVRDERGITVRHQWNAQAYGSIPIFFAVAATGAGLDAAALVIQHKAHIGPVAAVLALAVPVGIFLLAIYWLYGVLYAEHHRFHLFLLGLTVFVLVAAPALAYAGAPVAVCLLVVMAAPAVTVVGYETYGYRHADAALQRATAVAATGSAHDH